MAVGVPISRLIADSNGFRAAGSSKHAVRRDDSDYRL
jgi:hypothetical protein